MAIDDDVRLLARPGGIAGGGGSSKKGKTGVHDLPSIRAALVKHEQEAAANALVSADPDRYAAFLELGLAMLLSSYALSTAAKVKSD